jgi:hypothetical protein
MVAVTTQSTRLSTKPEYYSGGYALFNGSTDYMLVPDSQFPTLTGDMAIKVHMRPDDWTPATTQQIVAKSDGSSNISFNFTLNTGGTLTFNASNDGTSVTGGTSTAAVTADPDGWKWVAVEFDADNGMGAYTFTFYTSSDGVTWTQLGNTIYGGGTYSIFNSTTEFIIGGRAGISTERFAGKMDYIAIYDRANLHTTRTPRFRISHWENDASTYAEIGGTVTFNGSTTTPGYATFPGTASNYLSTPDAGGLDITGDITLLARIAPDTWTPAASQTIISKWNNTSNQRGYRLDLATTGALQLFWSTTGSDNPSAISTANLSALGAGTWKWVAVTLDVVDGANKSVRFWTADVDGTWTQLGATVTTAGNTSIFSNTSVVSLSGHTSGTLLPFDGKIEAARIHSTIGASGVVPSGGIAFRMVGTDITDDTATSFTATSGHTVTVNGSATLTETVTRQMWELVEPSVINGVLAGDGDWRLIVERLESDEDYIYGPGLYEYGLADGAVYGDEAWNDITADIRGMEWERGAQEPFGRPMVGTMSLTIDATQDTSYNPWTNASLTRPGTLMRAGLISDTDTSDLDGWIPLWAGLVDTWSPTYVDPHYDPTETLFADKFVDVTLVETISELAQVDENALGGVVGSGEKIEARIDRLLTAATWRYGMAESVWGDVGVELDGSGATGVRTEPTITLQSTDMSSNRISEIYLSADSTDTHVRSDVTGAVIITSKEFLFDTRLSKLAQADTGLVWWFQFVFTEEDEIAFASDGTVEADFDTEPYETANDAEAIKNDMRLARVGGTQQVAEHGVSIGRFGRKTYTRSDLICSNDADVLVIATKLANRLGRSSLRVDNIALTLTGKATLPYVAAMDISENVYINALDGSDVKAHVRSMKHNITPMDQDRLHWTAEFAVDAYNITSPLGATLPLI